MSRKATAAAVVCSFLALGLFVGGLLVVMLCSVDDHPTGRMDLAVLSMLASYPLGGLAVVLMMPLSRVRLWRVRRALRRLSPQEQTDVVVAILTEPGEKSLTRELAGSLRLERQRAAEVTPAGAVDGRGSEPGVE